MIYLIGGVYNTTSWVCVYMVFLLVWLW